MLAVATPTGDPPLVESPGIAVVKNNTTATHAILILLHMERGWMTLHDAVGINCKEAQLLKNQGSAVKYVGSGVYLDDCVCVLSDLT